MSSAFETAVENTVSAPRCVITLKDEHWASTFSDRPVCDIKVGLRLLSIEDQDTIRRVAIKATQDAALNDSDPQVAGHQALLVTTVARAICNPKDATRCHDFFSCPDDLIPLALTEKTVKWLFDEIERLTVTISPIFSEANDEEIVELCSGLLEQLSSLTERDPVRAARVRRYLMFVMNELIE